MSTYFPIVPVEVARGKQIDLDAAPLPALVLVVNEEPVIAETLAAILNGRGFAAVAASSGDSALDIADLIPPDLLITDVTVADMSGFDLAIEVTRRVPDCGVILFCGPAPFTDNLGNRASHDSGFSLLLKPVHPAELLKQVFEQIERKKAGALRGPATLEH